MLRSCHARDCCRPAQLHCHVVRVCFQHACMQVLVSGGTMSCVMEVKYSPQHVHAAADGANAPHMATGADVL